MEYQLRHYRIRPGTFDLFLEAWLKGVYPLRQSFGFRFVGVWADREKSEFVWVMGYGGPGSLEEADRRYYASPERNAMDPDPAQYIEPGGTKLTMASVLG